MDARELADVREHGRSGETPLARFDREEAAALRPLIDERGSLLITFNRSVGEWGEVFGDPVAGKAPRRPREGLRLQPRARRMTPPIGKAPEPSALQVY